MTRLLTAALLFTLLTASARADNWPQWRGPKNDGHSAETGIPAEWGPDRNVVWTLKMPGQGESTPCVWGDRMFLTSTAGEDEVLLCVGTDGKEKWRQVLNHTGRSRFGPDQATDASASCSTDGKHVWTFIGGRTGRLFCHDLDGKLVWEKNVQDYGKFNIQFGTHWTPVLYDGKLYLQVMHRSAQKLVKLDAATGKEEWAVDRKGAVEPTPTPKRGPESPDVYASAFVWEGEGGPLLIAHGNDYCTAHRLDDGAEVWRVEGLNPTNNGAWRFVSNPMLSPDLIVIPSCKNGPTVAINPVGAKGSISPGNPAELWRITPTPDVVAPIRVGDVVYLMNNGKLTALEAKTGKQLYEQQLFKEFQRSNMVFVDGKLIAVGRAGTMSVVKPGPKFELIATNKLPDKFSASPALAGGRMYLRGWDTLWAIGTK